MALEIATDRPLRSRAQLEALVQAVLAASPDEHETHALEWKGEWDLSEHAVRFHTARHLLGFGNRSVGHAQRVFGGHAYLLAGVEPGHLHGIPALDPAQITDALVRYVAPGRPDWTAHYVEIEAASVLIFDVAPPAAGDRICTLRHGYDKAPAGRVYARHHGRTVEAGPDDIGALEDRLLDGVASQGEHLALARKQAAQADEARARVRAPSWEASRLDQGFALTEPHRVCGHLHNHGESAAIDVDVRLQHPSGAVPGAIVPVYGSGPAGDPGPRARIEDNVTALLVFDHPALAGLRTSSRPLTIELRYEDDAGFKWRTDVTLRRSGADASGRLLWTVREVHRRIVP